MFFSVSYTSTASAKYIRILVWHLTRYENRHMILFHRENHRIDENLTYTGFIRGILRGDRYAKSLRVLFLHRRSPSWTTLVLYSRVVFIFNEPTTILFCFIYYQCSNLARFALFIWE
jgi:hypothetical protein